MFYTQIYILAPLPKTAGRGRSWESVELYVLVLL